MTEAFPSGVVAPQEWLDGIMPRAPNVSLDFVKFTVLRKAREFFTKSGAWRDWVGPITLHDDTPLYSVELSDYKAQMISLLGAYRLDGGADLYPMPDNWSSVDIERMERGEPRWFFRTPEGMACIFPMIPLGTTMQVKLYVTMQPVDLCMPSWVRERHYDAICDGVLSVICFMKGPTYDPALAARLERRFKSATSAAAQDAVASGTGLGERITPPLTTPRGSQQNRGSARAVSGTSW